MAEIIKYYIDPNNNYYIDTNGNYYIAGVQYDEIPTKLHYIKYKPYFYSNGSFKKYTAYIRQADGSYVKYNPYVYTLIEIAIANMATAGISRASS